MDISRLQQLAGLLNEEDTSGDAEMEQYINGLLDSILDKVSELEKVMGGDMEDIFELIRQHKERSSRPVSDEELPF